MIDENTYAPLATPLLAVGDPGYTRLKSTLASKSIDHRVVKVTDSGHFIPRTAWQTVFKYLDDFLN